jgi:YD repeat-containing protein
VFTFDLAGNRLSKTHTGPGGGADEGVTYQYNGDNQLTVQVSSLSGETDFAYDLNGSQLTSTHGSNVTTYTYNVRNKMVAVTTAAGTTSYVYNDAGQRVQEAVISGGTTTTTFYLTDEHNPTGYAQPIEEWTTTSGTLASASLNRTYVLGDHVFAQADGTGQLSYLLTGGHGSTRLLTDATSVVLAAAGLIVQFATTRVGDERRP